MSLPFTGTERFQLLRRIGAGGMGVVYEALDRETNTRVALKTLRILNGDTLLRFKTEFRSLQDLQHPNLVSLGELMQENGHWFFTMELVEGQNFLRYVGRDSNDPTTGATTVVRSSVIPEADTLAAGPAEEDTGVLSPLSYVVVDEDRLRHALGQLIFGLRALHQAGKVHRDVKPSNCLVTREGRAVLLDFGLIADLAVNSRWSSDHDLVGTVAYMAPEQAAGQPVGPEADLYSVGVVLYEALTSVLPFSGMAPLILQRKQSERPQRPRELLPDIPHDFDELCMNLLEIDPRARPSADEVLARLGIDVADQPKSRHSNDSIPLPHAAAAAAFIGRQRELDMLWQAYHDARTEAVSVLVTGESGVGKSTLVSQFTSLVLAQHARAVVLVGRCHEREAVPYKAFDGVVDMLSQYLGHLPAADAATFLPRRAALLLQVFPVLERVSVIAEAPRGLADIRDPQELRSRVFAAMRELLAKIAEHHPLVIVIEDIQWSDADSLALLDEILRPPDAPLLLLVATRRTAAASPESKASISASAPGDLLPLPCQVRHFDVPRLSRTEARELAERLMPPGATWAKEIADLLAVESEGHPLFLDELVRHVDERGRRESGEFQLEDALWARVQALDPAHRVLLEVVCTAGRPIEQAVAADAARLRRDDLTPAIRTLLVTKLARTTGPRFSDAIEPYHDRVRAAIVARLAPEVRRAHHQAIVRTLEARSADPEPLSFHWLEAGDKTRAAHYAALAAIEAAKALAFDRAVRLYRQALELGTLPERTVRGLWIGLGDTLVNAGRGGEAAEAYMAAARLSTADKAVELRRRAVEQWLRSGHVREGFAALDELLGEIGLRLPGSRSGAIASLLGQRAWLRLRGLHFDERKESELLMRDLMKIDLCWSVAAGIGMVDPIVGQEFIARNLRLSLRAGEPYRLSRALSMASMSVVVSDRKGGPRAAEMLMLALGLAHKSQNPHAIALATMAEGFGHYWRGSWKAAVDILDRADLMFREQCTNFNSGSPTSRLLALWSLFYLGELPELFRRLPVLLRQAEERGDLQAAVNLGSGVSHLMALAEDDPGRVHDEVSAYMKRWKGEHFYFQNWSALVAQTETDLYRGNWQAALTRLERTWPEVEASHLLRIQKFAVDGSFLQARCLLAAAAAVPGERKAYLGRAEALARSIEREETHWSPPLALLIRAASAALRGQASSAARDLASAAVAFERADMALHAAVARYCRGQLLGGDAGRALHEEARRALGERGIRNPAAMVACLAPGLSTDAGAA